MNWNDYRAALFDLDGVLTPTTDLHMRAWSQMFNDFLSARGIDEPYTDADYFAYVDGKPRYEGVASFLASRGIELPVGQASDIPETDSVCGLGNRKNEYFNHVLARDGIAPYPGSLRLLDYLAAVELPMAVVSSSRNAEAVLDAAGLVDYFTVVMDGNLGHQLGLPGKPAPDVFVRAAQLLDVPVAESVVLEDALSGVAAGAAGGFGLVVGIDRGAGADALEAAGADIVVADCEELLP
ncbi:MAG: beta-phosphoglucomutase family hydrolase [Propionibacterium sp.]|uniref:Beta-phosphoglucomutase n=1 Tax=Brooklawnia propionicigenes TaxID=3041175 RepID=A0AAN0K696_9ACTN|nr:beta-phosphoglucomutase family hydrolase [Brooklawnia sp. SH051]NLI86347.1 beta-phosphoglucomutase family hydrolase [Propionibacterium sp.]BEH01561.1 beta-phosphoglucomutase family hydrolase [Brooklawnia sp. SH051]